MQTSTKCLPCFVRQAEEAVSFCVHDEPGRTAIMRQLLSELATAAYTTPVAIAGTGCIIMNI